MESEISLQCWQKSANNNNALIENSELINILNTFQCGLNVTIRVILILFISSVLNIFESEIDENQDWRGIQNPPCFTCMFSFIWDKTPYTHQTQTAAYRVQFPKHAMHLQSAYSLLVYWCSNDVKHRPFIFIPFFISGQ
jgi:hypothetical protein